MVSWCARRACTTTSLHSRALYTGSYAESYAGLGCLHVLEQGLCGFKVCAVLQQGRGTSGMDHVAHNQEGGPRGRGLPGGTKGAAPGR